MAILRGTSDTIEVNCQADISEDLGKVFKARFKVTFKRHTVDEAKALLLSMSDPDTDVNEQSIIRDDVVGWRDLQGDGGVVPFNKKNLEAMVQHFEYLNGLMEAWSIAQMGRVLANTKN